jgi:glycosyltransferase involved in cell wall biosynthesis
MDDSRFRSYLMFCNWMRDMFATGYDSEMLRLWFGGIDLSEWPDAKHLTKSIDVLVYDKIRWNRDTFVPNLLQPILDELSRRGLRFHVLEYGRYTHPRYRALLKRSRSMIFLCEHETQGMAYQESLASDVPVLAWDQGYWLDPNRHRWESGPVAATSVPYFSDQCGERFKGLHDLGPALDRFMSRLASYSPRRYVSQHLSLTKSAELYLQAYHDAAADTPRSSVDALQAAFGVPIPTCQVSSAIAKTSATS